MFVGVESLEREMPESIEPARKPEQGQTTLQPSLPQTRHDSAFFVFLKSRGFNSDILDLLGRIQTALEFIPVFFTVRFAALELNMSIFS